MKKSKKLHVKPLDLISLLFFAAIGLAAAAALILTIWFGLTMNERLAETNARLLSEISNDDHGDTWEEVIENMRHDEYESMVFFDEERSVKLLDGNSADALQVSVPEPAIPALQSCGSLVHLHSHPGDSTFSDNDLCFPSRRGLRNNIKTMVVVAPNHLYEMAVKGDASWPSDYAVLAFFDGLVNDNLDDYTYEDVQAGMTGICFNDRAMREFAEHFDMEYTVTKLQ